MRDHQWIQASDDVVHERLQQELLRVRGAATSMEALGAGVSSEVRGTFLSLTKTYHPNRFARRSETIRNLANEVFLEIKRAYDRAKAQAASDALTETKARLANEKQDRLDQRKSTNSRPPVDPSTRQVQKDRRRSHVRNRLSSTTGSTPAPPLVGASSTSSSSTTTQRMAQVRAATDRNISDSGSADLQEAEFEKALSVMSAGDFSSAAAAFKTVAISRPSEKRYRLHMHYAQGRTLQGMGKIDEARAEYKRCLGLDASFVMAHESMASLPKEGKKKGGFMSKLFGK